MQEVFKKIIERLRQEKDRDRSEVYSTEQCDAIRYTFGAAIDAVKVTAAEYNNGWIPCKSDVWNDIKEKGLPPVGQPLIVTIKDNLQGMPNQLRHPVYYVKDTMKDQYIWKWIFGDMIYDLSPEVSEVIAWRPLPEPYQQHTCAESDCPYNDGKECPAAEGCAGYQPKGE